MYGSCGGGGREEVGYMANTIYRRYKLCKKRIRIYTLNNACILENARHERVTRREENARSSGEENLRWKVTATYLVYEHGV